jgi:hypothetical protein
MALRVTELTPTVIVQGELPRPLVVDWILQVPELTAVTRPPGLVTVQTAVLLDAYEPAVKSAFGAPLAKNAKVWNWSVCPTVIVLTLAVGVVPRKKPSGGFALMVTVNAGLVNPPKVAVMLTVPAAIAVTKPDELTVAKAVLLDDQDVGVTDSVVPLLSVPIADNWEVPPTTIELVPLSAILDKVGVVPPPPPPPHVVHVKTSVTVDDGTNPKVLGYEPGCVLAPHMPAHFTVVLLALTVGPAPLA